MHVSKYLMRCFLCLRVVMHCSPAAAAGTRRPVGHPTTGHGLVSHCCSLVRLPGSGAPRGVADSWRVIFAVSFSLSLFAEKMFASLTQEAADRQAPRRVNCGPVQALFSYHPINIKKYQIKYFDTSMEY